MLLSFTGWAGADDLKSRQDEAAELANQGFDLMQEDKLEEAIELFRKADQTFHSPVFQLFIAEAEEKRGNLAEAHKLLRAIVDEELADYAPEPFHKAQRKAKDRLEKLEQRIPKLDLTLKGLLRRDAEVELDDKRLPREIVDSTSPIAVNPGRHRVVVMAPDGRTAESEFLATVGVTAEVKVSFEAKTTNEKQINWLFPGIAYGLGGAALVVGIVTGGMFISRADELKSQCPNDICPLELEEEGNEVSTLGTVSTVGWVVAGVGVVAGTVLVFVPIGGDEDDEQAAAKAPALRLGLNGISIQGRF